MKLRVHTWYYEYADSSLTDCEKQAIKYFWWVIFIVRMHTHYYTYIQGESSHTTHTTTYRYSITLMSYSRTNQQRKGKEKSRNSKMMIVYSSPLYPIYESKQILLSVDWLQSSPILSVCEKSEYLSHSRSMHTYVTSDYSIIMSLYSVVQRA